MILSMVPATSCPEGILNPYCHVKLKPHGDVCCCSDINDPFWMTGYCYHCPECVDPKSDQTLTTYRSWNSKILALLPHSLSAEFPARLTQLSALSITDLMCLCLQNGMGAK